MRRFSCFFIGAVFAVVGLTGCRSGFDLRRSETQMRVGVDAARDNLWREALFRFNRAVEIDPQNAMARNNLAVAYEGIGEFEKARAQYTEALRLDRTNPYLQKNYSRFVEFYSRNLKRERKLEVGASPDEKPAAADDASPTAPVPTAPETPPVTREDEGPSPVPPTQNAPAATPGTAPVSGQPPVEEPPPAAAPPPPVAPPSDAVAPGGAA